MIRLLLAALALALALPLEPAARPAAGSPASAPAAVDDVEAALAAFVRATTGSPEEQRAALERLVALADADAVPTLQAEFARVSTGLRQTRDELFRDRYALEHQRRTYERLQLSAEHDKSLESVVSKQAQRIAELAEKVERAERKAEGLADWYEVLGDGTGRFFEALPSAKRKKAEKELWAELDEAPDPALRLAAAELLGYAGSSGTATEMEKRIRDLTGERARLSRELPKELVELRDLEQRWQKEAEQNDGRTSQAIVQQYERAKQAAVELQRSITMLGFLADVAAEAGGRALAREEGKELERDVQKLVRAQAKAQDGARRRILRLLAGSGVEEALVALRALLIEEKEPGARAAAIVALSEAGDQEIAPALLGRGLADPDWIVRSASAAALARLRVKEAIPALIDRLEAEDGRLRTDVREALVSLTGRDFRTNIELWRRFWREQGEAFVVPPLDVLAERASEDAKAQVGVTFFGIETESRRVLFVLDLSRSMTFSMVPRRHPGDEDPADPDMPREGELSRLAAAKQALTKALGGIEDGSVFNLVFYATDVWTWQDRLVGMDTKMRADAQRYVEALDANGGTNIYGALATALELAGAEGGDAWRKPEIDTIYFLSDGRPSVGVTTEADEILAMVRERNSSAGIVIHTIGLSGAQDAYLLRSLAEQNGGIYVSR